MTQVKTFGRIRKCAHVNCQLGGRIKAGETAYITDTNDCYHRICYAEAFPVKRRFSLRNDGYLPPGGKLGGRLENRKLPRNGARIGTN